MATTAEVFIPLLTLLVIAWLWHEAMGARERARMHAARLCRQARLQLLDETVALRGLRLRRSPAHGLQFVREYGFEVSSNGNNRLPARLQMAGQQLQAWSMPTIEPPAPAPPPAQATPRFRPIKTDIRSPAPPA